MAEKSRLATASLSLLTGVKLLCFVAASSTCPTDRRVTTSCHTSTTVQLVINTNVWMHTLKTRRPFILTQSQLRRSHWTGYKTMNSYLQVEDGFLDKTYLGTVYLLRIQIYVFIMRFTSSITRFPARKLIRISALIEITVLVYYWWLCSATDQDTLPEVRQHNKTRQSVG
jgi:hypothetical protein